MSRRTTGAVTLGLFAVSCGAGYQEFVPAERVTARSPAGYEAAEYEIDTERGELGEVKIWADGAYRAKVDGQRATVVELGMYVENSQRAPLSLTELRLDSVTVDGASMENVRPVRIEGPTTIEAGQDARLRMYFALPNRFDPEDVKAFRLKWQVQGGGASYTQRTPFLEAPEPPPYYYGYYGAGYYHTPFYDPFFYDSWYYPGVRIYNRPFIHRPRVYIQP